MLKSVLWIFVTAMVSTSQPFSKAAEHPTIFLIGDSTVRNGRGDGAGALWGWGDFLVDHFDTNKIRVVNRALGGRSSRTFLTEGLWDKVRDELRPGDFVLIQFGHNDGGPLTSGRARASLKGNGDETREVTNPTTREHEVVHTYGWYLRKYVADAKSRGATPVVLSLVPRNIWTDERTVARSNRDYGQWAAEAARQEGAFFVDLNELVARKYEEVGRETVASTYFGADHTHTTPAGARVIARVVAEALKALPDSPFARFLAN